MYTFVTLHIEHQYEAGNITKDSLYFGDEEKSIVEKPKVSLPLQGKAPAYQGWAGGHFFALGGQLGLFRRAVTLALNIKQI